MRWTSFSDLNHSPCVHLVCYHHKEIGYLKIQSLLSLTSTTSPALTLGSSLVSSLLLLGSLLSGWLLLSDLLLFFLVARFSLSSLLSVGSGFSLSPGLEILPDCLSSLDLDFVLDAVGEIVSQSLLDHLDSLVIDSDLNY